MKGAQGAEVKAHRCNEYGRMELAFTKPSGPLIEFWPPSNVSYGEGPQVYPVLLRTAAVRLVNPLHDLNIT